MQYCSFCGKSEDKCKLLIEGPNNIYICNNCVHTCDIAVKTYIKKFSKSPVKADLNPKNIVSLLDEYVIGQEKAKKSLAVNVYNHYKKIALSKKNVHIAKSNLLLLGPTGVGKTYLLQQVANLLDVPFMTVDTSQLTPKGYKGSDLNDVWVRLFAKCGEDQAAISRMENAIVYFDEIDKLTPYSSGRSDSKEFYGMLQNELLKVLEDSELTFSIDSGMGGKNEISIDSSNILFIFGGAFSGIENIIEKRLGLSSKTSIGFNSIDVIKDEDKTHLIEQVNLDDIREFGMSPEFIGRISSVVNLNPLSIEDLVNILTKPKNNVISQYKELFSVDGVELVFEDNAITAIAEKAYSKKTGARGLKSIIESSLLDIMYEIPSKKNISQCIITKDVINENTPATLVKKKSKSSNVVKIYNSKAI